MDLPLAGGELLWAAEQEAGQFALLTNGPQLGASGKVMAQVYLERWNVQENTFKHGAAAVEPASWSLRSDRDERGGGHRAGEARRPDRDGRREAE